MKIKLDANNRKFIEIEVELNEKIHNLKYFEKNTKQIKELKEASLTKNRIEVDELNEKQFFENLKGEKKSIKEILDFYNENGSIYEFINKCDVELGKLFKED